MPLSSVRAMVASNFIVRQSSTTSVFSAVLAIVLHLPPACEPVEFLDIMLAQVSVHACYLSVFRMLTV